MSRRNTKLTVYLTPKSVEALELARIHAGRTGTAVLNRAIQLYYRVLLSASVGDPESFVLVDEVQGGKPINLLVNPEGLL